MMVMDGLIGWLVGHEVGSVLIGYWLVGWLAG